MAFLPGNVRRASTYAAGTPSTTESSTTSSATSMVTSKVLPSPNSDHVCSHHLPVKPSGSQVLSHTVANELTNTATINASTNTRKIATPAHVSQAVGDRASCLRSRAAVVAAAV